MRLAELLSPLAPQLVEVRGDTELEISGIAYDSRRVEPGGLFVCIQGFKADGHEFIPQARQRGAQAVVVTRPEVEIPAGMTRILVRDGREALGRLGAAFYGRPDQALVMIGVTGTNGKTTCTYLIKSILEQAGYQVGLLGTIQNLIGPTPLPAEHTTPESLDLHALLAQMRAAGVTHVVMEVSSHAIALKRIAGVEFDVGVLTNVTQDHLDFHRSFAEYLAVKTSFLTGLGAETAEGTGERRKLARKVAVVNLDDPNGERIVAAVRAAERARVLTYAQEAAAVLQARGVEVRPQGVRYHAVTPLGMLPLSLHLTGRFNVANSLAAAGAALALGVGLEAIRAGLEAVPGVPGRLERVDLGQDFTVLVDYAHTPDGLANLLRTARELPGGRRLVVFGCGGDRDRGKRPQMGEVAARLADYIYITNDNPRSEDPARIAAEIEAGVRAANTGTPYEVILDRREAIHAAIFAAAPGDIVLIAGKGHEDYQIFRDETIHFDDREVARECLKERAKLGTAQH